MKRVLILCDLFPPAFGPRMGYLCKYLAQTDWTPVVVSEKVAACNFQFLADICEVHTVNYYPSNNEILNKLRWIYLHFFSLFTDKKSRQLAQRAEQLLQQQPFDLILCSSYRTFPLPAAEHLAEKYHLPLIVDLRDIIEQYSGNEFISHALPNIPILKDWIIKRFKQKNLCIRNRILKKAACVTTVSEWHQQWLQQFNPQTHLIYNGYDPELFHPEQKKTDRFIITYTGRLLSTAMRDPLLFFKGLKSLQLQGILSPDFCRVYWYVDEASWKVIETEAQRHGVEEFMEMKGFVPASEIPSVLNSSSVLLLLTNKSAGAGPKGVMTTKLFESLAVEKPILCVRNDEGVLEQVLRNTNAGIAAGTVKEVCDFLQATFDMWCKQGYTSSNILKDSLKLYSRKEQAQQFVRLFEQYKK